ncbi:hypothetical protein L2Y90_25110 [Burkholderia pyrrocinia]|uniref:hypothetical protein n=1 Tax=Burkholderia pyrrocinia TaxID=60550 RepID=UPI00215AB862|nr:hypothetical protein [Burkholderia pyrrocinia]UVE67415.1 hypothetical protein L2Y90_25110 [Burkholderia pyrrocinia]
MRKIEIRYPSWYDEVAAFEHEEKGYLEGVSVELNGIEFGLKFYDFVRFTQDAADSVRDNGLFLYLMS